MIIFSFLQFWHLKVHLDIHKSKEHLTDDRLSSDRLFKFCKWRQLVKEEIKLRVCESSANDPTLIQSFGVIQWMDNLYTVFH